MQTTHKARHLPQICYLDLDSLISLNRHCSVPWRDKHSFVEESIVYFISRSPYAAKKSLDHAGQWRCFITLMRST